jgi:hypothetical protein
LSNAQQQEQRAQQQLQHDLPGTNSDGVNLIGATEQQQQQEQQQGDDWLEFGAPDDLIGIEGSTDAGREGEGGMGASVPNSFGRPSPQDDLL